MHVRGALPPNQGTVLSVFMNPRCIWANRIFNFVNYGQNLIVNDHSFRSISSGITIRCNNNRNDLSRIARFIHRHQVKGSGVRFIRGKRHGRQRMIPRVDLLPCDDAQDTRVVERRRHVDTLDPRMGMRAPHEVHPNGTGWLDVLRERTLAEQQALVLLPSHGPADLLLRRVGHDAAPVERDSAAKEIDLTMFW